MTVDFDKKQGQGIDSGLLTAYSCLILVLNPRGPMTGVKS